MEHVTFFMLKNQIFSFTLSPVCFVVYCYLCKCRNKKNECYPSKRTIANTCDVAVSSVSKAARLAKQQYMDMLVSAKCEQQRRETEKSRKELKSVRKRMTELEKILNKRYEDLALERITENSYQAMAPRYEEEPEELRTKEMVLSQAVEQAEDTYSRIEEFVPIISQYTDITELNTYILNELIERIVEDEKTVDEDGSKSQRVDIFYKFLGCIK